MRHVVMVTGILAAGTFGLSATSTPGAASDLDSVGSIVDTLVAPKKPRAKTRSLRKVAPSSKSKLRSVLRKLKTRAPAFGGPTAVVTTREEREEIQEVITKDALPKLDVEIFFDYDSADIRPKSLPDLTKLGLALRDKRLAGADFMIIGHTDASGGDDYNLVLSKKRAESVRQFLTQTFNLNGKNLIAIGYGEEQLKRPDAPKSDENRRVQFVNLSN